MLNVIKISLMHLRQIKKTLMNKKFIHTENYLYTRKKSLKKRLFRWVTQNSSNLFLRTKDTISLDPFVSGVSR
jgi:hypothetical protein